MRQILNERKIENTINNTNGCMNIGIENSKMLLELAKAEKSFSSFLEFLDNADEAERLGTDFESLRDRCILSSFGRMMEE